MNRPTFGWAQEEGEPIAMYTCKKCQQTEFRAAVQQTVDVELDDDGSILDVGFDFSDPEVDSTRIYCRKCLSLIEP